MIPIVAALLGAVASSCVPVPGANGLWQANIRWVIVGEIHGTNESPDAFARLVCLAAATGRPVTVALEWPSDDQAGIDAYLASDGNIHDQEGLLSLSLFTNDMQDGRGSVASVRLWETLRTMIQSGRIVGVVASDVVQSNPEGQDRDATMAQTWMTIRAEKDAIILALVGNIHAMRKPIDIVGRTIRTAASIMPAKRTITVNIQGNGGKAWNCQDDGCLSHDNGGPRQPVHGITYSNASDRQWDASYELGVPTTAAAPASGQRAASPIK